MMWDAARGQEIRTIKGTVTSNYIDEFRGLGFSADGKRIVTKSEKGIIRSWDAIKGQEVIPSTDPPPRTGQKQAVSPDGKLRIWLDRKWTRISAAATDSDDDPTQQSTPRSSARRPASRTP